MIAEASLAKLKDIKTIEVENINKSLEFLNSELLTKAEVKKAIEGYEGFEISDYEIKKNGYTELEGTLVKGAESGCYFAAERLYNNFSSLKYALSKYPDDTESEKTVYQINGIQTPGMFNARTVIKIKRNPILPKSLAIEAQKTNGSCNEPDVIKQLKDDSNDKCYIQENIRRWKKRIEQQEIQELMESLYI